MKKWSIMENEEMKFVELLDMFEGLFSEKYRAKLRAVKAIYEQVNYGDKSKESDLQKLLFIIKALRFIDDHCRNGNEVNDQDSVLNNNSAVHNNVPKVTSLDIVTITTPKELLRHISFVVISLSGETRGKYKKLLSPEVFTWNGFEQLAKFCTAEQGSVYIPFSDYNDPELENLFEEIMQKEEISDAATSIIVNHDTVNMRNLFSHIYADLLGVNIDANAPKDFSMKAVKAFTSRYVDRLNIAALLSLMQRSFDGCPTSVYVEEKRQEVEDIAPGEVIKLDQHNILPRNYDFDNMMFVHAALRRLHKIGEMVSGKHLSSRLKTIDDRFNWDALIELRNRICHQDESDNYFKIKELTSSRVGKNKLKIILTEDLKVIFNWIEEIIRASYQSNSFPKLNIRANTSTNYADFCQRIYLDFLDNLESAGNVIEQVQKTRLSIEEQEEFFSLLADHDQDDRWRELFSDLDIKLNKTEEGELRQKSFGNKKDSPDNFKRLGELMKKAFKRRGRDTQDQREQDRELQQQEKIIRDSKKEENFKYFETLRELVKALSVDSGRRLCNFDRINNALESLRYIEIFMQNKGVRLEDANEICDAMHQDEDFKEAVEYNISQCLGYLEYIKQNTDLILPHSYIDQNYEKLRNERNYLAHGNYMVDTAEYEPGRKSIEVDLSFGAALDNSLNLTKLLITCLTEIKSDLTEMAAKEPKHVRKGGFAESLDYIKNIGRSPNLTL